MHRQRVGDAAPSSLPDVCVFWPHVGGLPGLGEGHRVRQGSQVYLVMVGCHGERFAREQTQEVVV
eukprot:9489572-Pyramimonas_sp.AAC.1